MPISPSGWGRFVAGGTGSTWVFFVPACVVLLFVVNAFLPPYYSPDYVKIVPAIDVGLLALLGLIWYFVIGRIPRRLRVRDVRHQIQGASTAYGVQGRFGWLAFFDRREDVAPRPAAVTTVVATADGLEFWGGPVGGSSPIRIVPWSAVASVSAGRRGALDLEFNHEGIQTRPAASEVPDRASFTVLSDRWFAGAGMSKAELAGFIDRLRRLSEATPKPVNG
jgi:hypothetical protein